MRPTTKLLRLGDRNREAMKPFLSIALVGLALGCSPSEEPKPDPLGYDIPVDSATHWCHVRDQLLPHCVTCHEMNGPILKGEDEDIWANLQREASNGKPYVLPSQPEQSYLWHKIAGSHLGGTVNGNGSQMPPGGFRNLNPSEVLRLQLLSRDWIANGAGIDCGQAADAGPPADAGPAATDGGDHREDVGGSSTDTGMNSGDDGGGVHLDAGAAVVDAGLRVDTGPLPPPDAGQNRLDCAGLRACYADCAEGDNTCQNLCLERATPEAEEDINRLLQCIVLNGCHEGDLAARQACTAQFCAPQLALCE